MAGNWLLAAIQQVTSKGEGSTSTVTDATTQTKSATRSETLSGSNTRGTTNARGAKVTAVVDAGKVTTRAQAAATEETTGADSKNSTQTLTEDAGASITFKIRIRGGLTAGTAFAALCEL